MASESLLCEVKDGHARLTLNRPEKHNPLDGELVGALSDTLAVLADDPALPAPFQKAPLAYLGTPAPLLFFGARFG